MEEFRPELMEKTLKALSVGLNHLDIDLQKLVSLCFENMSVVARDTEGDVAKLGEGWIHLGYLQMILLAPKGPVDPVERLAIKLKILKEEVRYDTLQTEINYEKSAAV